MHKRISVSIIVPVYNAENTIINVIDKIIGQKVKGIELILINDGSTDKSLQAMKSRAEKDNRVIIIDQKNAGASAARNTGIHNAKGKYLMFFDADDDFDPDIISTMIEAAQKKGADLVQCGMTINNAEDRLPAAPNTVNADDIKGYILKDTMRAGTIYGPYCKVFLTKIIKDNVILFDEECRYGEDLIFNLNYCQNISTIYNIDKSLYYYNLTAGGLSSKSSRSFVYRKKMYKALNEFIGSEATLSGRLMMLLIRSRWTLSVIKNRIKAIL